MRQRTRQCFDRCLRFAWVVIGFALAAPASPVQAQASPVAPSAVPVFDSALARKQDSETLTGLTADGQLLYQRERIRLDGYAYCSQSVAAAERGDFRDSVRAASKALFLGRQQNNQDLIALSMRDLAIAYSYAGDLDHASQYAREALRHDAKTPALVRGPAYKVLGDVAVRRGQLQEAIGLYGQAEAASSERFRPLVRISLANAHVAAGDAKLARAQYDRIEAPAGPLLPLYHRGLGNLLLIEGRAADARGAFERAASTAAGADATYHRVWALEGIARSELALGNTTAARGRFVEAARLSDAVRARFRSEEFKIGLFGDMQKIFEPGISLLSQAGEHAAAWSVSEQSRSRALLDVLRERVGGRRDAGASPGLSASVLGLSEVTGALRDDETLIQFHSLDDRLLAWVITPGGIRGVEIGMSAPELAAAVEAFRAAVFDRRRSPRELAVALHRKLIAPLDVAAGRRLVIVPHGPMHYLPFQALHSGDGYLIEGHALAVAPSASVAVQLNRRSTTVRQTLVAFGNPANPAREDLPGAQREVQLITRFFTEPRAFFREDASKTRFRELAGAGRILHVAAHAEVDALDPLQSRILLAQEPEDPGSLAAREIYGLDLSGVSLVTLSACESGLGRIARGDEILGFTRSFLSAGASSLLVSLWPVADNSTELLMTTFYDRLAQGSPAIDAIQAAQVAVLKTPRFAHPFFWAPFNLLGDWRLSVPARPAAV